MSSLTPVRDAQSASRDLSVSGSSAMLRGLPRSGAVIRPQPLFYVALLRRGSAFAGLEPQQRWDLWRKVLRQPRLTVCGQGRRTVALRTYSPHRLKPPLARTTAGLPALASFPIVSRSLRISPQTPSATVPLTLPAYTMVPGVHERGNAYPRYPPNALKLRRKPCCAAQEFPCTAKTGMLSESRERPRAFNAA
jgi:hypothetical protein